jgi:16S rRNA (guanine527-N7)-methyltransferase
MESVSGQLRIELTAAQAARLDAFADLILAGNARAGLMSAGTTLDDIRRRHFPESLNAIATLESERLALSPAIDIGSGGGLPGIPLAIARPTVQLTLLESTAKKARFLERAVADLGLANVTVAQARAEEAGRDPARRAAYRLAMVRAVAPLPVLLELALPLLAVGGVLAAIKGSRHPEEITASVSALDELGGSVTGTFDLGTPGGARLVLVRKDRETPDRYPRRTGIPAKRPL